VRRREFICGLGASLAAFPGARAQSQRSWRIGVLTTTSESDAEWGSELAEFLAGLKDHGWNDGVNCRVSHVSGGSEPKAMVRAAGEVMRLNPDVVVARSTLAVKALVDGGSTAPVVFVSVGDPVGEGFAASMARPGGRITGFTNFEPALAGKWVELLRQVTPSAARIAVVYNPQVAVAGLGYYAPVIEAAARAQALDVKRVPVSASGDIDRELGHVAREGRTGLVIPPDAFVVVHRRTIIEAAARHRLPAVYPFRNMAVEGGLLSYGVNVAALYRRCATYVDRILRGANPGELPIQTPIGFELVLNAKTAKALGLTIPPTLLARADEVIE